MECLISAQLSSGYDVATAELRSKQLYIMLTLCPLITIIVVLIEIPVFPVSLIFDMVVNN